MYTHTQIYINKAFDVPWDIDLYFSESAREEGWITLH
jgi:hypothetical protein